MTGRTTPCPHLQRALGPIGGDGVWCGAEVLPHIDPLHRAKPAHKVDVHDLVHAEEHEVGQHPALLALLICLLVQKDLARRRLGEGDTGQQGKCGQKGAGVGQQARSTGRQQHQTTLDTQAAESCGDFVAIPLATNCLLRDSHDYCSSC
jgi:hypothetical protein